MTELLLENGKKILLKQGDITLEKSDAIVNPANSLLRHGGGAARAIALAGGETVTQEGDAIIAKIGHLPVGKAVITHGGKLAAKFIIHTVGPQMGEGDEDAKLEKAIWSVLTLAESYALGSLSLPAVSSGIFGFPKARCAKILLATTRRFLLQDGIGLLQVTLCNHDQETCSYFEQAAQELKKQLS